MQKPFNVGFVTGKFSPFHIGHELLLYFASQQCNKLLIQISDEKYRKDISNFFNEKIQSVSVVFVRDTTPLKNYKTDEFGTILDNAFWDEYKDRLKRNFLGSSIISIDAVFSSDQYGKKIAEMLGCYWIPVDPNREITNGLSATRIKEDVNKNFQYISDFSKHHFRKRIMIVGPESVGKSTMATKLSSMYKNCAHIPEYGRTIFEQLDGKLDRKLFSSILIGQESLINKMSLLNHIVISDTESLVTANFYDYWFEDDIYSNSFWRTAKQFISNNDLYILLSPTVPFINDGTRNEDESWRIKTFNKLYEILRSYSKPMVLIRDTNYNTRISEAKKAIDDLIGEK